MSIRSVTKGTLEFREVGVPVKLYLEAKEDRLAFKRICPACQITALGHKAWCVRCAAEPHDEAETLHGLIEGEDVILFVGKELDQLDEPADSVLRVIQSSPATEMRCERFDGSHYFVGIDSAAPRDAYRAMLAAIAAENQAALVRLVLRGRERFAMLYARGGVLMLSTLFYAGEIRDVVDVPLPEAREVPRKQLALARALLKQLPPVDLTITVDRKGERVHEYVDARKRGDTKGPELKPATAPAPPGDLTERLEASIGKNGGLRSGMKSRRGGLVDRRPRSKQRVA